MIVNAGELAKALRGLKFVAPKKASLPVLSCVLVEQTYGTCRLIATNLDQTAIRTLGAGTPSDDLPEPLRVCVYVREFYKLANNLDKSADVYLTVGEDTLEAESDGLTVTLRGFNANEFPDPPTPPMPDLELFEVDRDHVHAWEKHLRRFASSEKSRPVLNGVRVREADLVATNGHVALMERANGKKGARGDSGSFAEFTKDPAWIVPKEAFRLAYKILPNKSKCGPVRVLADPEGKRVAFVEDSATLITRTIEGPYPNFEMVIPTDPAFRVELDAGELLDTIAKVKPFVSDQTKRLRATFNAYDLHLVADTPDRGTAEADVPILMDFVQADCLPGEGFVCGFNADYLERVVAGTRSPRVTLELTAPERAVMVKGGNGTDALIMPLRLLD